VIGILIFHVELDVSPVSRVQRFGPCISNPNRVPHFTTEKIVTNSHVRVSSGRNRRRLPTRAVICVYDAAGNVIETLEHAGDLKEW
jgi:hypothetical protein